MMSSQEFFLDLTAYTLLVLIPALLITSILKEYIMRFVMKPLIVNNPPANFTIADGVDFVTKQPELLEHIEGTIIVSADEKAILDASAGADTNATGFKGLTVVVE